MDTVIMYCESDKGQKCFPNRAVEIDSITQIDWAKAGECLHSAAEKWVGVVGFFFFKRMLWAVYTCTLLWSDAVMFRVLVEGCQWQSVKATGPTHHASSLAAPCGLKAVPQIHRHLITWQLLVLVSNHDRTQFSRSKSTGTAGLRTTLSQLVRSR